MTKLYKMEPSSKVRERLLLILKVKHDDMLPAHAADELHRSRPWSLYWLDRFSREGIKGIKDRSKSGRPTKIPKEVAVRIRKELLGSKHGWTTKQVRDVIFREGGVSKISLYSRLYDTSQMGFQTKGTKKSTHQYSIR